MNPVIHVIRLFTFRVNIQIIIFEHVAQLKAPQESISQRVIQLHVRIHAQTSGQRETRPTQILVGNRGIQQNCRHFL